MRNTLIVLFALAFSTTALADGPHYQVFPQLKGLVVNYNVTTSKVETTLYVTNHERTAIICDANMATNRQEITKGRDTTIAAGKTATFSFRHGKSITDVRLYLMCEASKNTDAEHQNVDSSTTETSTTASIKEQVPVQQPTTPIVEEDLGHY